MASMEDSGVHRGDESTPRRIGADDATALRDLLMVRLRRRGATLGFTAAVLGSSPATVHRRMHALPDEVRRALEEADVTGLL